MRWLRLQEAKYTLPISRVAGIQYLLTALYPLLLYTAVLPYTAFSFLHLRGTPGTPILTAGAGGGEEESAFRGVSRGALCTQISGAARSSGPLPLGYVSGRTRIAREVSVDGKMQHKSCVLMAQGHLSPRDSVY